MAMVPFAPASLHAFETRRQRTRDSVLSPALRQGSFRAAAVCTARRQSASRIRGHGDGGAPSGESFFPTQIYMLALLFIPMLSLSDLLAYIEWEGYTVNGIPGLMLLMPTMVAIGEVDGGVVEGGWWRFLSLAALLWIGFGLEVASHCSGDEPHVSWSPPPFYRAA